MFMRSYVCTRDIHKRVMFANYRFANITSFVKFAKISSRENFQVHGIHTYIYNYIYEHEAIQKPISENNIGAPSAPQILSIAI